MELKLFFDAIKEEVYADVPFNQTVIQSIFMNGVRFPSPQNMDIALIGVPDYRGTHGGRIGNTLGPDNIRKKLYALKKGSGTYKIIDLGNLRLGHNTSETQLRLREVCHYLMSKNILPVILGGSHDLLMGQYLAYEDADKMITWLNVDAYLDLEEGEDLPANRQITHSVLTHEPNYLFNYIHLAYQSYLNSEEELAALENLHFDLARLGEVREKLNQMEPVIRDADMVSIDVSAIQSFYCPGTQNPLVFGLSGEEACQISWYAGLNEKLSSIGFYEYLPEKDHEDLKTAMVIATMIWYFIEGFYHRKGEKGFASEDYIRYVVQLEHEPETITFYKSKRSEKWWMEVPHPQGQSKFSRNIIVPCSYQDYEEAGKGEIPERWVKTLTRMK